MTGTSRVSGSSALYSTALGPLLRPPDDDVPFLSALDAQVRIVRAKLDVLLVRHVFPLDDDGPSKWLD
jgi:hypothetical protein